MSRSGWARAIVQAGRPTAEAEEIEGGLFDAPPRLQISRPLPSFRHCPNSTEAAHPQTVGARADAGQGASIGRPSGDLSSELSRPPGRPGARRGPWACTGGGRASRRSVVCTRDESQALATLATLAQISTPSAAHFLKSHQPLGQKFAADRDRQKGRPFDGAQGAQVDARDGGPWPCGG